MKSDMNLQAENILKKYFLARDIFWHGNIVSFKIGGRRYSAINKVEIIHKKDSVRRNFELSWGSFGFSVYDPTDKKILFISWEEMI